MTFSLAGQSQPVIAKNVAEEPLDAWDNNAVAVPQELCQRELVWELALLLRHQRHELLRKLRLRDAADPCGGHTLPARAGDPYGSGAWAYYPSAGYSWVSPYPWGWTPYHYGSWAFCQGIGWGWQPGGAWMGLANLGPMANAPAGVTRPRPPNQPPSAGHPLVVPVNLKPLNASSLDGHDKFVFRGDSAGLGVPRGTLGKLNGFSRGAAQHGMASTSVSFAPRGASEGQGRGAGMPEVFVCQRAVDEPGLFQRHAKCCFVKPILRGICRICGRWRTPLKHPFCSRSFPRKDGCTLPTPTKPRRA